MTENRQLVLRKRREFGEIISDAFTFLKMNIKPLSIGFLRYVLPFVILGGYCYGAFFSNIMNELVTNPDIAKASSTGVTLLVFFFGVFVAAIINYTMVYGAYSHQLVSDEELTVEYLGSYIMKNVWRVLLVFFFSYVLILLPFIFFVVVSTFSPALGLLLMVVYLFAVFYFLFSWMLAPFIAVHEEGYAGPLDALRRSRDLISGYWWPTFGLMIVASLIVYIMSFVFTLPLQVVGFGASLSDISTSGEFTETSSFVLGLFGIISFIGSTFASMYTITCLLLKYSDLKERKGGAALMDKIDEFGTSTTSTFENEGDF